MAPALRANDKNLYANALLMQQLADQPIWTTNNIDPHRFTKSRSPLKVPLDAYALLHEQRVTPHANRADRATLLTLRELQDLPAAYVQRVLFNDVTTTHMLCVDVESDSVQYHGRLDDEADDSDGYWRGYVQEMMQQTPAVYTEASSHGGWHRLYYIPDDLLKRPAYQALWQSNLKFPFHTLEVFGNGTHAMTLTTQVITDPTLTVRDVTTADYHDRLENFLDECLSQLHRSAYVDNGGSHQGIKHYHLAVANPQEQQVLTDCVHALQRLLLAHARRQLGSAADQLTNHAVMAQWLHQLQCRAVDKTTGSIDLSKRDWVILGAIAAVCDYEYSHVYTSGPQQGTLQRDAIGGLNSLLNETSVAYLDEYQLDANLFCLIVATTMRQLGERYGFARSKWDDDRNGQPWLLYDTILLFQHYGYQRTYGVLQ